MSIEVDGTCSSGAPVRFAVETYSKPGVKCRQRSDERHCRYIMMTGQLACERTLTVIMNASTSFVYPRNGELDVGAKSVGTRTRHGAWITLSTLGPGARAIPATHRDLPPACRCIVTRNPKTDMTSRLAFHVIGTGIGAISRYDSACSMASAHQISRALVHPGTGHWGR